MGYDLKGKTCLITGGCGGIGFETARELSRAGATTVLVCRDKARGEAARSAIAGAGGGRVEGRAVAAEVDPRAKPGAPAAVEMLACDLASQKQIRALAEEFKRRFGALHVLVNNAAAVPARRTMTEDGLEMQFAVNHLAYFLLTGLLLDVLKASAPARIVNVSSGLHRRAHLDFGGLQAEKGYKGMAHYSLTKLLNIHFTYELARRLEGTGVTANTLSPGFTASGLGRNFGPVSRFVMKRFGRTADKGADTVVYLAASPEVEGVTGAYFNKRNVERTSPESYDAAAAARLWALSEDLTRPR
jgi:NAD(P)-dependent dehydrogenase (short-subunit alcohol dehydrogenase family)